MRALLLYGFLPALLVAAALAWGVGVRVRRIPERGRRRFPWAVLVTGVLLVFGGIAMILVVRIRQGVSFCEICGVHERQVTLFSRILEHTPLALDDPDAWMTREYTEWYARAAVLEHEHAWTQAGLHTWGFGEPFALNEFPPTFHRALPRMPDAELARALVRTLARAAPEARADLLRDFAERAGDGDSAGLMRALSRAPLSAEEFAAAHAGWLAAHPLWAGVSVR